MNFFLSVVIPAFNEELRIKSTVRSCSDYLSDNKISHEIIIVDDGSTDGTWSVLGDLEKELMNIKLLRLSTNKGKGAAVKSGMELASGSACLFTDADGSTPIKEIEKLMPHLSDFDVVIGSRALLGSEINKLQPWYRRLSGKLGNKIIKFILGLNIEDTQCGFKLFSGGAARNLFSELTLNRFGFDVELLALAKHRGFKVKEIPVKWEHKENSKVTGSDYIDVLLSVFKVKLRIISGFYK